MSYGLPCPADMNPADVFTGVESYDQTMAGFVTALLQIIRDQQLQVSTSIGMSIDVLKRQLKTQIKQLNEIIGQMFTVLTNVVSSGQFLTNVSLQTTINDIATALQTTTEDVLYGSSPGEQGTTYSPPSAPPPAETPEGLPATVTGAGLPATSPVPTVAPAQPLPPPTVLVMDGLPVSVNALCNQIQNTYPVNISGTAYLPTLNVYNSGAGIVTGANGQPIINVGFDRQADGSLVVNVGPVYVQIAMPPANPDSGAPACPIVPLIS